MSSSADETTLQTYDFSQSVTQTLAYVSDLIQLMKPRILVLLLIATLCPMVLAAGGTLSVSLFAYALIGGLLISGSASVMNCILDRDIDAIMERTRTRPLPAGRVSVYSAGIFSFFIGLVGFLILCVGLNPGAAYTALFGHFFYVVIYTLWLKRSTPQNIVIGGAAGAIPPIVGWVGVTGELQLDALLLFLLIFLWTPPHFWALALNKNEDYRRAGVPMLPVVAGEKETHKQMMLYAVAMLPVSIWLVVNNPHLGWFSGTVLTGLGVMFIWKIAQLCLLEPDAEMAKTGKAWDVFGFSLIYLGLFFVCLVVDSVLL